MSVTVTTEVVDRALVARLAGELDRDAGGALADIGGLVVGKTNLVLDFSGVDFMSSSGLALLVRLLQATRAAGATVSATGLDEHYRHVFEITRLDEVISVTDDGPGARAPEGASS